MTGCSTGLRTLVTLIRVATDTHSLCMSTFNWPNSHSAHIIYLMSYLISDTIAAVQDTLSTEERRGGICRKLRISVRLYTLKPLCSAPSPEYEHQVRASSLFLCVVCTAIYLRDSRRLLCSARIRSRMHQVGSIYVGCCVALAAFFSYCY